MTDKDRIASLEREIVMLNERDRAHEVEVSRLMEYLANLRRELVAKDLIAAPVGKAVA